MVEQGGRQFDNGTRSSQNAEMAHAVVKMIRTMRTLKVNFGIIEHPLSHDEFLRAMGEVRRDRECPHISRVVIDRRYRSPRGFVTAIQLLNDSDFGGRRFRNER